METYRMYGPDKDDISIQIPWNFNRMLFGLSIDQKACSDFNDFFHSW